MKNNQIAEYQNMFSDYPDILTVKDIMKILKIGRTFAYSLLSSGQINYRKIGNKYYITKISFIDFINNSNEGANQWKDIYQYKMVNIMQL